MTSLRTLGVIVVLALLLLWPAMAVAGGHDNLLVVFGLMVLGLVALGLVAMGVVMFVLSVLPPPAGYDISCRGLPRSWTEGEAPEHGAGPAPSGAAGAQ